MNIMKYFILSLVFFNCILAEIKIGYVDSNEIMSNFEEVRQVQVDLEKEQRRLEGDFNILVSRLDSLKQDYERKRLLMSETRRNEKENDIRYDAVIRSRTDLIFRNLLSKFRILIVF